MVEIFRIHIDSGEPMDILMRHLEGKVFHVTKECHWPKINKAGRINPNIDGKLATTFCSSNNSYFKNNGCVSVFDYRNIYGDEQLKHMYKCLPTSPLRAYSGIVILIFKPEIYPQLLSWERWKYGDQGQMVVPYVEAGFSGSIPLELVEKALIVTMVEAKKSLAATLQSVREKK